MRAPGDILQDRHFGLNITKTSHRFKVLTLAFKFLDVLSNVRLELCPKLWIYRNCHGKVDHRRKCCLLISTDDCRHEDYHTKRSTLSCIQGGPKKTAHYTLVHIFAVHIFAKY